MTDITIGTADIAKTGMLRPQSAKVLAHLLKGHTISPLEAQFVYKIARVATCIDEIRKLGYEITTTRKRDGAGSQYASYRLAAKVH